MGLLEAHQPWGQLFSVMEEFSVSGAHGCWNGLYVDSCIGKIHAFIQGEGGNTSKPSFLFHSGQKIDVFLLALPGNSILGSYVVLQPSLVLIVLIAVVVDEVISFCLLLLLRRFTRCA